MSGFFSIRNYYSHIVPMSMYNVWFQFITLNNSCSSKQREIAFQWKIQDKSPMQRFQFIPHTNYLRSTLISNCPHAIHLGGVYLGNLSVREEHARYEELHVKRFLVFDVDMSDYEEDRNRLSDCHCEKGARSVCDVCWNAFMEPSRYVLEYILRNLYGFKHFLHIFSGRRGYHVYVLDSRARNLTRNQRNEIASVFENLSKKQTNDPLLIPVCHLIYPRIDANVTKRPEHLCKIPLSLHAVTRNVSTPLPPPQADSPWFALSEHIVFGPTAKTAQLKFFSEIVFSALRGAQ
jgi:DNA primase catalytic subunit